MGQSKGGKLGLIALIAIVMSSMIGGGVYSLPQNIAQYSAPGPAIIAWIITGIGLFFIANSFSILANARPDLKAGIYMYAHEGFNPFAGFLVAWGYWLMTIFGNVAFAVILMDALNTFFPGVFTNGNNLTSIICGSILIWGYNLLVSRGVKVAGFINFIGTIGKTIPLLIFIIVVGVMLDYSNLTHNFWGNDPHTMSELGSPGKQITNPLMVTLWVFVGVEGAVVLSGNAKNPKDVGKATLIGFFLSLFIYIALSILPYSVASQDTLAKMATPSTAEVLKLVIGEAGSMIMSIGVIISVMTGWLAWTMLCAEIPMAASENGTFPKFLSIKNGRGAAKYSLLISSAIMQIAMILVYFSKNAWNTMVDITSVMVIPAYLATTLFLFKYALKGDNEVIKKRRILALMSGLVGFLFCAFMLYASNPLYVAIIPLLLTLGVPLYIWAKKENRTTQNGTIETTEAQKEKERLFRRDELLYLILLLILDAVAITALFLMLFKH